ncbi:MAG: toll/interleukin-1 receptor domain-containing protein, partial [Chloroflexi bacterium]|nr:toll/interleukin-1 receptor domain-containing protein [Chloroflexota bacterium]
MKYDTAKLRQFIQEYFSTDDLRTLLFDYFRPVHDDLSDGMAKSKQIALLLEYCHNHGKTADLLASLQRERDFFEPSDYAIGNNATAHARPSIQSTPIRNSRQIFISHAHQDAEIAQKLAHDLEANGYDIWIAPDSIRPGEKWV